MVTVKVLMQDGTSAQFQNKNGDATQMLEAAKLLHPHWRIVSVAIERTRKETLRNALGVEYTREM